MELTNSGLNLHKTRCPRWSSKGCHSVFFIFTIVWMQMKGEKCRECRKTAGINPVLSILVPIWASYQYTTTSRCHESKVTPRILVCSFFEFSRCYFRFDWFLIGTACLQFQYGRYITTCIIYRNFVVICKCMRECNRKITMGCFINFEFGLVQP